MIIAQYMLNPVGKTHVTDPLFKYSANFFYLIIIISLLLNLITLINCIIYVFYLVFFSIVKLMLLALLNQFIFLGHSVHVHGP